MKLRHVFFTLNVKNKTVRPDVSLKFFETREQSAKHITTRRIIPSDFRSIFDAKKIVSRDGERSKNSLAIENYSSRDHDPSIHLASSALGMIRRLWAAFHSGHVHYSLGDGGMIRGSFFIATLLLTTSIPIFPTLLDQTTTATEKNFFSSPPDEEIRETLNSLILMYKDLNKEFPEYKYGKKRIGNRINGFLDSMFVDKPGGYSSDYIFKMVRLLMIGSFFDKKVAKGLSYYLTSFYAKRFGVRWDEDGDGMEGMDAGLQEEKTQSNHDIIMKYAKTGVGLTILSIMTYLFYRCVDKFLENPEGLPSAELSINLWLFKLKAKLKQKNSSEDTDEMMGRLTRMFEAFRGPSHQ